MSTFATEFTSTVLSQTFDLCGIDMYASFVYIPFYFYFKNTHSQAEFMPTAVLEESFYKALLDFPLFAGYLCEIRTGWLQVVVDKHNLNMPEFKESQCNVHFDTLQAANFNSQALPKGAATTTAFAVGRSTRSIKLAKVHVMRLASNSGVVLFVSVAHGLVDAVGYCTFINHWADICRYLVSDGTVARAPQFSATIDRSELYCNLPSARSKSTALIEDTYTPGTALSKAIALVAPHWRARILGSINALVGTTNSCYHISQKSLDALRDSVASVSEPGQEISYNDVLTALIGIVVAQSISHKPKRKPARANINPSNWLLHLRGVRPDRFDISMAVDIRPRLSELATRNYCGNGMVKQVVQCDFENLLQPITLKMLAAMAGRVRQKTKASTADYISQFIHAVDAEQDCFVRPVVAGTRYPMKVLTTNHTRVNYYAIDFGWGIPVHVNPIEGSFPNFVGILPASPPLDGYHVHVMASKSVHSKFKSNSFWMSHFDFVH